MLVLHTSDEIISFHEDLESVETSFALQWMKLKKISPMEASSFWGEVHEGSVVIATIRPSRGGAGLVHLTHLDPYRG
jgi:hypothetical protein